MDQWLYREGDLVLGPVPAKHIVDKLYAGELGPATQVQQMGSSIFRRVGDVPEFKLHVAKAEVKKKADAHEAAHHQTQRRKLGVIIAIVVTILAVLGGVVAAVGRYMAVHSSTRTAEEIAWGDITIDAPTITRAKHVDEDELMDYPGNVPPSKRPTAPNPGTTVAQRDPAKPPDPKQPKVPTEPKPKMGTADTEGMQVGEVDQNAINDVIARHRSRLIPCLKAVAKPGMAEKIPIEFSITEAGKVSKVWVDNPTFKTGPLPECLLKELQSWPFKASPGGGATVNLSFNIGNPAKKGG